MQLVPPRPPPKDAAESGSVLLTVLAVVTVLTLMGGAVLAVYSAQYRFIRRDAHRLQARYTAEAGVYAVLDRLRADPYWRPSDEPISPSHELRAEVTVAPFGGYLLVRSVGRYGRSRCVLRALVGERPPSAFNDAVYLWDTESSMNVAGRTRVVGDLSVGLRGVKESSFKGRPFTGRVSGEVRRFPDLEAPFFDPHVFDESLAYFDAVLRGEASESTAVSISREAAAWQLPGENDVRWWSGDLRLGPADSALFARPVTIAATGSLTVEGPLAFAPGTLLLAGDSLRLHGPLAGREGLFYGRQAVVASGPVHCAGSYHSRTHVRLQRGVDLPYPSVLYLTGEAIERGGAIVLESGAALDGLAIHPRRDPAPDDPRGRVVIADSARVRGAVYNGHETEVHGSLLGALLTHRLYFYESPTSYINWLKDATVDVTLRPLNFSLPLRFSESPHLEVLSWEILVDEPPGEEPA